jgi:SAM-dependent methyltransferase
MTLTPRTAAIAAGSLLQRAGYKIQHLAGPAPGGFDVFLAPAALQFNEARLRHLGALGFAFAGKRVLEVGAGIGLLSEFFERQGAQLVSTEGRADNVAEIKRRYPQRTVKQINLDAPETWASLGTFDFVFCYGTLYHLARPEEALRALSSIGHTLLLETATTPGDHDAVHLVRESESVNQALALVGCRPTRPWIMRCLRELWGYAYVTVEQPDSDEFETDWELPYKHGNHRAVFVASRDPLSLPGLTTTLPARQPRFGVRNGSSR